MLDPLPVDDGPAPDATRTRPGLPLDPLLQLWAGSVETLPVVTWTGGASDPVAVADPMRVALYVVPLMGGSPYRLAPAGQVVAAAGTADPDPRPSVMHCRDYPGLVQGAWVGSGTAGVVVAVYSYTLSDQWR